MNRKRAGLASDLNNELDSLLATIARLFEQSKRRGRFAPCNPDFLIKNLAEEAKRLQEYEKATFYG